MDNWLTNGQTDTYDSRVSFFEMENRKSFTQLFVFIKSKNNSIVKLQSIIHMDIFHFHRFLVSSEDAKNIHDRYK